MAKAAVVVAAAAAVDAAASTAGMLPALAWRGTPYKAIRKRGEPPGEEQAATQPGRLAGWGAWSKRLACTDMWDLPSGTTETASGGREPRRAVVGPRASLSLSLVTVGRGHMEMCH